MKATASKAGDFSSLPPRPTPLPSGLPNAVEPRKVTPNRPSSRINQNSIPQQVRAQVDGLVKAIKQGDRSLIPTLNQVVANTPEIYEAYDAEYDNVLSLWVEKISQGCPVRSAALRTMADKYRKQIAGPKPIKVEEQWLVDLLVLQRMRLHYFQLVTTLELEKQSSTLMRQIDERHDQALRHFYGALEGLERYRKLAANR